MSKSQPGLLLALLLGAGALAIAQTPARFQNSAKVHELIRAGNLYLTLQDALALAIENNLDIELSRYDLRIADTELLRAKGGGLVRGLSYEIAQSPTGVGIPLSPVVTNPASSTVASFGAGVPTNALELGALGEQLTNLTIQGPVSQSIGPPIPIYDPAIVGQLSWSHTTTPLTNTVTTGTSTLLTNAFIADAGIQQGFGSGGAINLAYNNNRQSINSIRSSYNPFTNSSLGLTVTQPLLRGFGLSLNRRFINIAKNEQRISSQLFRLQLSTTVYGVIRLYTDLVALNEDVKVKRDSVALAEKLFSNTKAQVEEGTLAQIEMTRANALIFSSRQDLINAQGLLEEQEAIIKSYLTRRGNEDPELQSATIVPTDPLNVPDKDEARPIQDLIADAVAHRPDLRQANLQMQNFEIGLKGARNALLPQVDLVGVAQNAGLSGALNPLAPGGDPTFVGGYGSALDQLFTRKYPTYSIGVQVTIPVRNRIAEADLARDEMQLRQSEIRQRQLLNQARLQVEDALIAMRRARASYEAATQARVLQEQSLQAEQVKFDVGASTSFFVIQYESLLAQSKSTEVAAKSAYVKARAALQFATGGILDANQISLDKAYKGHS
jgi:outer membrane protein